MLSRFVGQTSGAVTVDMVTLTALCVALTLAVTSMVRESATAASDRIGAVAANVSLPSSNDTSSDED